MSAGNKVVPVRIDAELRHQIELAIASRNAVSPEEPDTVGSWIRRAIREKLAHLGRKGRPGAKLRILCETCGNLYESSISASKSRKHEMLSIKRCVFCEADNR